MIFDELFPTPRHIIHKMLAKITNKEASHFLDPSAGSGNIAEVIRDNRGMDFKVDCIEISPELADVLRGKGFPVVGYDFLTYPGVCFYEGVLMNPPFSEGARHLLRAWDFMHDGEIVCLLNEETLSNPHTAERQRLCVIIAEHGNIEKLGDCFARGAERSTGVNVVMVYLKKVAADDRIEAWSTGSDEKPVDDNIGSPDNMLAIKDELGNMEHYYNEATTHMLKAFQHIRKASLFMEANGIRQTRTEYADIIKLAMTNINSARAEFSRAHRHNAWMRVFDKMQFRKWLDKKQRDAFLRDIETNSNIPFTTDNIKGTLENVFLQRNKLFEMSVANVFDELTRYFKGNTNHTEGWKSNDSYKVNRKLVFPYGCRHDSRGGHNFGFDLYSSHTAVDIYNDLDRILAVLDGHPFDGIATIEDALRNAFHRSKEPGICDSTYFEIRYFKKGTIHLKWNRLDLWEAFNIKAAAGKKWIGENTQQEGAA